MVDAMNCMNAWMAWTAIDVSRNGANYRHVQVGFDRLRTVSGQCLRKMDTGGCTCNLGHFQRVASNIAVGSANWFEGLPIFMTPLTLNMKLENHSTIGGSVNIN